jgi:hypothetical protein
MPDIVTSQIFSDGEKGITATKMNNIIANSVIQPDFVTAKPSSSTLDPTDQLLEVKGAGTYARITGQQLIDSVSASVTQNITPTIWSVRLRSFNAVGNPNAEVCQRNISAPLTNPASGTFLEDRWIMNRVGTFTFNAFRVGSPVQQIVIPGTNFVISSTYFRFTLTGQQASLGATDYFGLQQSVEGIQLRELIGDVHSTSILVESSVAGLKFGISIVDPTGTRSLCKLCTISSANTWTLITLPNLPVFPPAGTFNITPGNAGYLYRISLGAGSTYTAPANDTWQNGNFIGALGQSNFAASAVNSTFDIAFVQHEPGAQCSTPIDCPFEDNLRCAKRYYQKSWDYGTAVGTGSAGGYGMFIPQSASAAAYGFVPFVPELAKSPTLILYSNANGGANSAVQAGSSFAINSPGGNTKGINSLINSGGNFGNSNPVTFQWTADTGW